MLAERIFSKAKQISALGMEVCLEELRKVAILTK